MNQVFAIIKGTPIWVWGVFIYLLFVGIKAIETRIIYLPKLFIVPVILLGLKYQSLVSEISLVFIAVFLISLSLSFIAHRYAKIEIIKSAKSVQLPGSYSTLLILISFFAVKYTFGYLNSVMPEISMKHSIIDLVTSGIFSGYVWGRSLRYAYKYFCI